jgi:hypothetical protein
MLCHRHFGGDLNRKQEQRNQWVDLCRMWLMSSAETGKGLGLIVIIFSDCNVL